MTPTWIGLLILLIGALLLMRGTITSTFGLMMACSLFGGSAAVSLPALGGSSIPPAYMALGLLVLRILLNGGGTPKMVGEALRENVALAIFCFYGVATALILPRVFAGALQVTPLRGNLSDYIFAAAPLRPGPQNITSAVYLFGTLLAALASAVVARSRNAVESLTKIFAWTTLSHVGLGVLALGLTTINQTWLIDLIRNGGYAQLDQAYGSFIRIAGFFPEASAYAAYGIVFMALCVECWMRGLQPRLTGWAALCIALTLLLSTSSSAYLGVGGYAAILILRLFLFPGAIPPRRVLTLVLLALCGLLVTLTVAVAVPRLLHTFTDMISHMTLDKADSVSGRQRRFWAEQGIEAFKVTWGLGVGAGSFRSSSLATAIMGSMGVVGLITFVVYVWTALKPLRGTTFGGRQASPEQALGASCGWALIAGLIPAIVASPSPDPGLLFGVMGGIAIALRRSPKAAPRQTTPPYSSARFATPGAANGAG